ncbi:MAG TPA: trypsin-like peptidase domain-containing protein [Gemmataceae bacterium]|nr:trypsin-like peptidase domain-containing protein [Gemmataceae bacterium]
MRRLAQIVFIGICAFLGGLAASLSPRLTGPVAAQLSVPGARLTPAVATDLEQVSDRFEAVAKKASPAVVAVDSSKPAPARSGGGRPRAVEESGSGVLVRLPGQREVCVLTNNHVVQDATPGQITVSLGDGRIFRPDRLWTDPETDIAVLRLPVEKGLATVVLGDSDRVRVGQWVLAIGSPFGLNQTVTHGIISARERGQVSLGSTIRIKDFLQTDAAINPGSSGGPLFNLDGEVIGINTAIASHSGSNSGVAFSIPINLVKRVTKELLERGGVSRGYLGVQLAGSFEATDALKLGLDRVQGALVESVYPGTPAATAGLKVNDVLLEIDGTAVRNENHFINLISALPPGRRIRLQVWRERRTLPVEAVVGDWTRSQSRFRSEP